ncbi:MAG: hypothetical protein PUK40_01615 [Actinomycetaceae bacterium]|nr:hypothetical protein [Actinomycetaceae bacterium]MDY6142644.1 hypothetical protein [Arcanobacterium sp.]
MNLRDVAKMVLTGLIVFSLVTPSAHAVDASGNSSYVEANQTSGATTETSQTSGANGGHRV